MTLSLSYAPVVWLLHFAAVYVGVSLACPAGLAHWVAPGVTAATAAALAFYAGFGLTQWRRWRGGTQAVAFVGLTNVLVCALSAVGSVWVALPAYLLPPCAPS